MKQITQLLLLLIVATMTSCIREEAPNAECDILAVDITNLWFRNNKEILTSYSKIGNNEVFFIIKREVKINSIEISHDSIIDAFLLTPGARIEANDTVKKDNNGIYLSFTTHSEDGKWNKAYIVKFIKLPLLDKNHIFGFENFESKNYATWYEINRDGIRSDIWASGNAGFSFTGKGKTPEDYPTVAAANGVSGQCIKLTTRDTGSFGNMAKMPIAAGNIFIGDFQSTNAMGKPLEATRFGLPIVPARPVSLRGFYKYTAGETFTDKTKTPVPEKRDTCAIYSVLYEIDADNFVSLDGQNVLSSDRIVLVAELENPGEPAEWTEFSIPFRYANGKTFDMEKLQNGEYAITVVASSSKNGAFFEGAVGSTLYIDELEIVWENK